MVKKILIKSYAGDKLPFSFRPTKKTHGVKSLYRWHFDIDKIKLSQMQILDDFKKKDPCPQIYQTRSRYYGTLFYSTIIEVLNALKADNSIYMISFYCDDEHRWDHTTCIVEVFKEENVWVAKWIAKQ